MTENRERRPRADGEQPASAWAILQHVPFEGPGLIAAQIEVHGLKLDRRHLYSGDAVPRLDQLAGLVVLGGPMGVGDTGQYPYLAEEIDLLAAAVVAGMPVLGVCLGAQLLACALGGTVGPAGTTELGIGSVTLTPAGERDGVLGPSGPVLPVLHWHGDRFTIPPGAELLASSDRCVNQAFRVGRAYGLQFHVELDAGLAGSMRPNLPTDIALRDGDVATVERAGSAILGRFFDAACHQSRDPEV